jgi:hypothetical protein
MVNKSADDENRNPKAIPHESTGLMEFLREFFAPLRLCVRFDLVVFCTIDWAASPDQSVANGAEIT